MEKLFEQFNVCEVFNIIFQFTGIYKHLFIYHIFSCRQGEQHHQEFAPKVTPVLLVHTSPA